MSTFLSYFSGIAYVATFLLVAAGVVAWRRVYSRAISDVQDRVITTQKSAIETLTQQVTSLTAKVSRLQATLATIRYALKQQGIEITVEDEYVTFKRVDLPTVSTIRMRRETVRRVVERDDTSEEFDDDEQPNSEATQARTDSQGYP